MTATKKRYVTNCVNANGDDINEMVDTSREITRQTFLNHVNHGSLKSVEISLGYCSHPGVGLTMAGDWAVSYHKSKYRGQPCVYFVWSAIEYIFI